MTLTAAKAAAVGIAVVALLLLVLLVVPDAAVDVIGPRAPLVEDKTRAPAFKTILAFTPAAGGTPVLLLLPPPLELIATVAPTNRTDCEPSRKGKSRSPRTSKRFHGDAAANDDDVQGNVVVKKDGGSGPAPLFADPDVVVVGRGRLRLWRGCKACDGGITAIAAGNVDPVCRD